MVEDSRRGRAAGAADGEAAVVQNTETLGPSSGEIATAAALRVPSAAGVRTAFGDDRHIDVAPAEAPMGEAAKGDRGEKVAPEPVCHRSHTQRAKSGRRQRRGRREVGT